MPSSADSRASFACFEEVACASAEFAAVKRSEASAIAWVDALSVPEICITWPPRRSVQRCASACASANSRRSRSSAFFLEFFEDMYQAPPPRTARINRNSIVGVHFPQLFYCLSRSTSATSLKFHSAQRKQLWEVDANYGISINSRCPR